MSRVAYEWTHDIAGTIFFRELFDDSVYYYGIGADWGVLDKKSLGGNREVFYGEIRLGAPHETLDKAKEALGAKALIPLTATAYQNDVRLREEYDPAHYVELRVIQSLPFETLAFNASVDLTKPDGQKVARDIEAGWESKTIILGKVIANYDMISVQIASSVKIHLKNIAVAIEEELDGREIEQRVAIAAVVKMINQESLLGIKAMGKEGNASAKEVIRAYWARQLYESMFIDNVPIFKFDSGEVLKGCRLRDPIGFENEKQQQMYAYMEVNKEFIEKF